MRKILISVTFLFFSAIAVISTGADFTNNAPANVLPAANPLAIANAGIPTFKSVDFPGGLKNSIAKSLLQPPIDRIPAQAYVTSTGKIAILNILDSGDLWSTEIDLNDIESAEIFNTPIAPRVFHFAQGFHFKGEGILIRNDKGQTKHMKTLMMGTGPEAAFSVTGMLSMQVIQMRASSIEEYARTGSVASETRKMVNPQKINLRRLFLANAEETARLAAFTYIRAISFERPECTENTFVQKYQVLGANCISSGIQNVSRAVEEQYRKTIVELEKKDINKVPIWNELAFVKVIKHWNQISQLAKDAVEGKGVDTKSFLILDKFQTHLREQNQVSLPWRAVDLIKWATTP
ncbi:MAG: hypothetical protein HQM08_24570 [Candidatus Riflebacteria bacterium]|nr:hypothetical protein [Candidatus Riflebacteria bacterium]